MARPKYLTLRGDGELSGGTGSKVDVGTSNLATPMGNADRPGRAKARAGGLGPRRK